jgi:hypothetical protein
MIHVSTKKNQMPRNELSWSELEKRLKGARALAEFLDLQSSGAAQFRSNHPDFLPSLVWQAFGPMPNDEPGRHPLWLQIQNQLSEVWNKGFPEKDVLDLISASSTLLDFANSYKDETRALDVYRKAILFLYGESWRAKEPCPQCKRHFIATASKSECCSVSCSAERRKRYKADRHKRIKKKLNAKRRREYAERRGD